MGLEGVGWVCQQTQADILSYRHVNTPYTWPPYSLHSNISSGTGHRVPSPTPHFFQPVFCPASPFPGLSPKPGPLQGLGTPSLLVLVLE